MRVSDSGDSGRDALVNLYYTPAVVSHPLCEFRSRISAGVLLPPQGARAAFALINLQE